MLTSVVDVVGTDLQFICQNYVKPNYCKLEDITKNLSVGQRMYTLRGAIVFHERQRSGLRQSNGHYLACALRSNDVWELYDDTKKKFKILVHHIRVMLNF